MQKTTSVLFAIIASAYSGMAIAQNDFTYGIGMGALYGGVGVNIGQKTPTEIYHLSLGCPSIGYSEGNGWQSFCGLGVGAITTKIIPQASNKHGIGGFVGVSEHDNGNKSNLIALGYSYYSKGISVPGWNLGFSPSVELTNGDSRAGTFIQIGYQY